MVKKQVVLLTGASGSMGFETFKLLWEKRELYDIVLLLRPTKKNRKNFRKYERQAGIRGVSGRGAGRDRGKRGKTFAGQGLKIVWGDALNREDVVESCRGIDWCLHTMALISPEADRNPEMAELVNARGTRYLVEAIEEEDPEHIRMVFVGSVAEYGDRLPPVHVGRTGDPVIPSIFDHYAITKIKGELAVMQSRINHRVSLRQTFIMIPDLFSLMDPIMFHQPIHSFMENVTARDAGRLMVNCLEIPDDSDFWGGYYNISGGPGCRTTFLEFLEGIYSMLGIRYRKVMERRWFALKNFHMQYFEDAGKLNDYLHHWDGGQTMESYLQEVWNRLPWYLKATAWGTRYIPPFRGFVEAATRKQLKRLAHRKGGTMYWVEQNDTGHINAFYGSREAFQSIPGWDQQKPSMDPSLDHNMAYTRLDHGYDESKVEIQLRDLHQAASFRGGSLVSEKWDGNLQVTIPWKCCQGHVFKMTPHAVLKGGHWCMECISPPWDYSMMALKNSFAAQVLA
jgi:nucleoside-diphosphate-sugar epimerase